MSGGASARLSAKWRQILSLRPNTAEEFMNAVLLENPNITELEVVQWQRSSRDWTTDVFELIWFLIKLRKGEERWRPAVDILWPKVKTIIDAECLDQLIENMFL
jgi:hypothetical protein